MKKIVLATLVGLVVAVVLVGALEWVSHQIYPPPADLDLSDREALTEHIRQSPTGALLLLVLAHIVAAIGGGFVAGKLSDTPKPTPGYIIGGLLLVAGVANLIMIPGHPIWFWVLEILLYVPAALVGYRFGVGAPTA